MTLIYKNTRTNMLVQNHIKIVTKLKNYNIKLFKTLKITYNTEHKIYEYN